MPRQQYTLDFAMKSLGETRYEGQVGLIVEGYATRWEQVDQEGEWTDRDSFANAARTFFDNSDGNGPVPILYDHGFDPTLSTKRIGRIVDWRIDDQGLFVKGFIPRPDDAVEDSVTERKRQVWRDIRDGICRGFSISGIFGKVGKTIRRVGLLEISATPRPCLTSAGFALASKSLPSVEALAGPDWHREDRDVREDRDETDAALLSRTFQIKGDPKQVARDVARFLDYAKKGVTKDGCPASCFLVVEDPGKPSTWHLQVRDPSGKPSHNLMGEAWAALHDGFRGNKYAGPDAHDALSKLIALYKSEGLPLPTDHGSPGSKAIRADEPDEREITPLSPLDAPGRLEEQLHVSREIAHLYATLDILARKSAQGESGTATETATIGAKAARKLRRVSQDSLSAFGHDLIDAGQSLLAWIDQERAMADASSDEDGDGQDEATDEGASPAKTAKPAKPSTPAKKPAPAARPRKRVAPKGRAAAGTTGRTDTARTNAAKPRG